MLLLGYSGSVSTTLLKARRDDMPAVLLLELGCKEGPVNKRYHMHLRWCNWKLQQEKSKALVLSQHKSVTISLHNICKDNSLVMVLNSPELQRCTTASSERTEEAEGVKHKANLQYEYQSGL